MTLTRTASTSTQALAMELGITDTAKKAKVFDLILALLTLERERDGWQPIETAPKDGTDILLYAPAFEYQGIPYPARVTIGHWTTDEECRVDIGDCGGDCHCREYEYVDPSWMSWDGGFTEEHPPTHWQPLPSPPEGGDQ